MLLAQVFVSSVAGVYNQSLLKGDSASLHAQNTMLYAFGVVINAMIHTTIRIVKPEEPSLFAGYTNLPSYLVILSNVFIGLAITAVYKCKFSLCAIIGTPFRFLTALDADAVIKCLATAVATGILLFLSPAISGTSMTPLAVPGGLIVFISSWLYVTSPAVKSPDEEVPKPTFGAGISKYFPCIPASRLKLLLPQHLLTAVPVNKIHYPPLRNNNHNPNHHPP